MLGIALLAMCIGCENEGTGVAWRIAEGLMIAALLAAVMWMA